MLEANVGINGVACFGYHKKSDLGSIWVRFKKYAEGSSHDKSDLNLS